MVALPDTAAPSTTSIAANMCLLGLPCPAGDLNSVITRPQAAFLQKDYSRFIKHANVCWICACHCAAGDPNSVINVFLRLHMQRQEQEQQRQQQRLAAQQQQEHARLLAQQQQEQLEATEQQQRAAHAADARAAAAGSAQLARLSLQGPMQMADELLALLDQGQQQQEHAAVEHHVVASTAAAAEADELAERGSWRVSRAVSPSDVQASFVAATEEAEEEEVLEDMQQPQQQQQQRWRAGHPVEDAPAELSQQEWLQQYAGWGPEQQMLRDMELGGAAQQQQQQRRRLSPDTLQRMHQEGLAK
jgi:hypothetical protein